MKRTNDARSLSVSCVGEAGASTACVNWSNSSAWNLAVIIHFPLRKAVSTMSQSEFDRWVGYVLHEVGHPAFTDRQVWDQAVRDRVSNLLNGIEDVRMEREVIDNVFAINAQPVLERLLAGVAVEAETHGWEPNSIKSLAWTLAFIGRVECNGYALDRSYFDAKLTKGGLIDRLLGWALPRLKAAKSTQDCRDLVDAINVWLAANRDKPEAPKEKPPVDDRDGPQGGQGEGQQAPAENASQGDAGDEGESVSAGDDAADGGEGDTADKPKEGKPGEGEGQPGEGDEGKPGQGKGGEGQPDADSNDGAVKDPSKAPADDANVDATDVAPKGKDDIKRDTPASRTEGDVVNAIRRALNDAEQEVKAGYKGRKLTAGSHDPDRLSVKAKAAAKQRAVIARALKAEDLDTYEGGRTSGRLDRRAFAKVAAGQANVFGRRDLIEGYETDVDVLVDASGSMSGLNIVNAMTLALVVTQAANQVGVSCTVNLFRYGGLTTVHAGGKRTKADGRTFTMATGMATGGTPLCRNMLLAAMRQCRRAPSKRKVMFVITDGQCEMGDDAVKRTAAYIEDTMGVEIAHMSIGVPTSGTFRNEVYVDTFADVAKVGLDKLARTLERGAI